ncbi:DUF6629 family protein [Nocardioides campestrisoli]|uniref:DUF6629 family protein n=1 Tax=Nocardioides campestrisoli TaxID=2736757 RepID=UPI001C637E14|nr:DUF6629 family protein [Nocardioides campestrisoli]
MSADLTAGVALLPVAAVCLHEVRTARELPFASLPLLFALHQLTEALVWHGASDYVSAGVQQAAALIYVLFALPFLPLFVPLAVLLLEPQGRRARVAPFVGLGAVVAAYLLWAVLDGPVRVREEPHALVYDVDLAYGPMWAVLYVVAVIGPSVLSGYPSIVAFGLLNLVGLSVVALVYVQAFASLWCVYAALTSVLVAVHMVRRRRLPDLHRLEGRALAPT